MENMNLDQMVKVGDKSVRLGDLIPQQQPEQQNYIEEEKVDIEKSNVEITQTQEFSNQEDNIEESDQKEYTEESTNEESDVINEEMEDDGEFDDVESVIDQDEIIDRIRTKVVERLRPHKFDLNSFTVAASPVKVANLVTGKKDVTETIDWYLPNTGINITMKKFDATEIVALTQSNSGKSTKNSNLEVSQLIYDHITNTNKPDFEQWINIVVYEDIEQLYFAILIATFKDNNYITYACPNKKCKDIDLVAKDYKDMIVFYDEKDREDFFDHIERGSYDYTMNRVEMERVQITDDYCVDIKLPSLYDVLIEPTDLSEKYRNKHQEKLAIISYIGNIYKIDYENNQLIEIDYSLKTDDETLIIKNKYRLYMQFLNSLNSDEYSYLTSIINKVADDRDICEFVIPEHKCEKCGTVIPAKRTSSLRLLFTRHQLAALATI